MKSALETIVGLVIILIFLWILFLFLGWAWDHKGTIFLVICGICAIGMAIAFLSNTNSTLVNDEQERSGISEEKIQPLMTSYNKTLTPVNKVQEQPDVSHNIERETNELAYMLQIVNYEYVQSTIEKIYESVEKEVGRAIEASEKALINVAVFIALEQAITDRRFRVKKGKSLARASSLAVMRALAFDIDEEASTTKFREKLNVSKSSLDKEIVNAIDNNLNDESYSKSTSRIILLVTTDFLNDIGFDIWKNRLDIDMVETNVRTLLKNLFDTIIEDKSSKESYSLSEMSIELCKAYMKYNDETEDILVLYHIS